MNSLKIYTVAEVNEAIEKQLADYAVREDLLEKVLFVLRRFDGKVINVRLKEAVRLALPEWTVCLERREYSGIRLCIWRGQSPINYDNQFSLTLAKKDETYARLSMTALVDLNAWYFAPLNSMLMVRAGLHQLRGNVESYVERWNDALRVLDALGKEVEGMYPLSSLFNVYVNIPREEVDTE